MGWGMLFLHDCMACGFAEERTFTDSYTGIELCLSCLGKVVNQTTNSPASEGDNLTDVLSAELGDDLVLEVK